MGCFFGSGFSKRSGTEQFLGESGYGRFGQPGSLGQFNAGKRTGAQMPVKQPDVVFFDRIGIGTGFRHTHSP